jgi:hypothetical protein
MRALRVGEDAIGLVEEVLLAAALPRRVVDAVWVDLSRRPAHAASYGAAMAKAHTQWTVLPHGGIERLSARLWRLQGTLPTMSMARVMTIARRSDGGLVVHNAIAVEDAVMAEIEAWGPIAAIVVPNGYHRLDAKVFHDRYPAARRSCR